MAVTSPVTLAQVIGWIESRNNPFALRFEPKVFARTQKEQPILQRIRDANACDDMTAQMIYSTSWGEYQLMGFDLYSAPVMFPHSLGDYLESSEFQLASFDQFCNGRNIGANTPQSLLLQSNALLFARRYNGGSAYAESIAAALQHFGVTAS